MTHHYKSSGENNSASDVTAMSQSPSPTFLIRQKSTKRYRKRHIQNKNLKMFMFKWKEDPFVKVGLLGKRLCKMWMRISNIPQEEKHMKRTCEPIS